MEFTLGSEWNDGMMEWWNIGIWESKTDDGLIVNSDSCHLYKIRSLSAKRGASAFSPRRRLHRLLFAEGHEGQAILQENCPLTG